MAIFYLRSTDGNDGDSGATWALAKATLAGAYTACAAGDQISVSQVHAETQASAMTLTSPGTAALPVNVICVNDGAEPATALATTATITTTGTSAMNFAGFAYCYGITFNVGSGGGSGACNFVSTAPWTWWLDTCVINLLSANAASKLNVGPPAATSSDDNLLHLRSTNIQLAASASSQVVHQGGRFLWEGGAFLTTATPTVVFAAGIGSSSSAIIRGVDLSLFGSGKSLVLMSTACSASFRFERCKLGASVSLTSSASPGPGGLTAQLINCDSGDTNYRTQYSQFEGDVTTETVIVRTGGASDGTTPQSLKMVSGSGAKFADGLQSPPFSIWNALVGSSRTVTVEIIHDSVTALTDGEVWLKVEYLGTSGFPLGAIVRDRKADILATAAAQTTSTATWTTTGITNVNKQKLEATFTPQEIGHFVCYVVLAKASYTIYVDHKPSVA